MGDTPEFSRFSVASTDFVALEASGGEPVVDGGWRDLEILRRLADSQKLRGHSGFSFREIRRVSPCGGNFLPGDKNARLCWTLAISPAFLWWAALHVKPASVCKVGEGDALTGAFGSDFGGYAVWGKIWV